MFDAEPFDPFSHALHVIAGFTGLAVVLIALLSRKGSPAHVWSGRVFVVTMLAAAVTSLIFMLTDFQAPARDAALLAIYAIGSGFLTLRPQTAAVRTATWALTGLGVVALAIMLQSGVRALQASSPLIVAFVTLGTFFLMLLIGDFKYYRSSTIAPEQRIRRHMSRMAWGAAVAIQAPLVTFNEALGVPFPVAFFAPFLLVPIVVGLFWSRVARPLPDG